MEGEKGGVNSYALRRGNRNPPVCWGGKLKIRDLRKLGFKNKKPWTMRATEGGG